ncbi:unnamed protein product [Orchesella dallaii]|uniref:RING-type domain-containing protein n=1 Tax=Orchesella dallaii TaxID=48710 RepID=A0ABP1RLL1_9HEXA
MEDLRECPICLEIPEKEIYQCSEGHIICSSCIEKVTECPQCRTNYGAKQIRCRVLEALLDKQMFQCKYNENGCHHLCRRSDISNHANICGFNQDSIPLCSKMNWGSDCKFGVACSGGGPMSRRADIINHLKIVHRKDLLYGTNINIKGRLIREGIQKSLVGRQEIPASLLLSLTSEGNSPLFLVVLQINRANSFISLNCIQLWGAEASKKYQVDCSIIKGVKKLSQIANSNAGVKYGIDLDQPPLINWTMNVYTPREMEYLLKSCPIGINKSVLMDMKFGDKLDDRLQINISLIK